MGETPTATGLIQFIHYAKKSDYLALAEREPSTLYLIQDSEEVYLGDHRYGVSVVFVNNALPPVLFTSKLYAVTTGSTTKFYKFDGTSPIELQVSGAGGGITADSEDTLTNKTIDAASNEIKNLTVFNFAEGVVGENLSDTGSLDNETLPTALAVYSLISDMMTIKHFL